MIVMVCQGVAGPFECDCVGQYLESCDFEARGGRGYVRFTPKFAEAKFFATKADAMAYWRTQSKTTPLRPDGKPNRPLTAYTVSIEDSAAH